MTDDGGVRCLVVQQLDMAKEHDASGDWVPTICQGDAKINCDR